VTKLGPYAEYKDSGVEWFPRLPASWSATKLKHISERLPGGTPDTSIDDYWRTDGSGSPWVSISDMSGRQIISTTAKSLTEEALASKPLTIGKPGTLLFAMYASVGEVTPLGIHASWNQALLGIEARSTADTRFLYYALQSIRDWLPALYRSNTQNNLNADQVGNFDIPLPPVEIQKSISGYLDRQTTQIDELIGKQERLIELLTEKRQAVVSDYIADMIQPTPRDLGMRLKHLYDVIDERANGADFPLMSVSIHRGLQRRDETTDDEPRADDLSNYKVCRAGDVVINRMRAFQGALGYSAESGLISPDYLVLRPHRTVDSGWLSAVLRSHWAIGQMRSRLRGIGSVEQGVVRTPRINASDLGEIRIRVPSATAQRSFLEHNQDVTERLDFLANKAAAAVDLLRERRSALISAAVTGKIDVREGVA
jgi:type I restriction enzyme S subunit